MWQHGPKISSRTTAEVSGNPVQIVGWIHAPPASESGMLGTPPPQTSVAPSSMAWR